MEIVLLCQYRHCEPRSGAAIQSLAAQPWIAARLKALAMTVDFRTANKKATPDYSRGAFFISALCSDGSEGLFLLACIHHSYIVRGEIFALHLGQRVIADGRFGALGKFSGMLLFGRFRRDEMLL